MRIEPPWNLETETIVGKPLGISDKILYPIIQISIQKSDEMNIQGAWITPLAIVVEEETEKYVIPLADENIDFKEFFKLVNHYKSKIKS